MIDVVDNLGAVAFIIRLVPDFQSPIDCLSFLFRTVKLLSYAGNLPLSFHDWGL